MDDAEFGAAYRASYLPLWQFARTLVRSDAEAHDVVQDVFLALFTKRASFVVATSLDAYLHRAVRNAALDRIRHTTVVDDTTMAAGGDPIAMGTSPDAPDASAVAHETEARLAAAVRALPERQRSAILLRWSRGLNATEVGTVLGISDTAARKLLTAAEGETATGHTSWRLTDRS